MTTLLYVLAGFAVGFEVGRQTAGGKCDWKRSLIAGGIAILVAATIAFFIR